MRSAREDIHQLVQHERTLKNRLQLATTRLAEAERERIWAIVAAHDAEQAGDLHFLVMEHVEGISLSQLLKTQGRLSVQRGCDYVQQAALGLQHAYEKGVIHRDLKPSNLLLTFAPGAAASGTVKILDMGLAHLERDSSESGPWVGIAFIEARPTSALAA